SEVVDRCERLAQRAEGLASLSLEIGKPVQDLHYRLLHVLQRRGCRGHVVPGRLELQLGRRVTHRVEEVGLQETVPRDTGRDELHAQVWIDEGPPPLRRLEAEAIERVDEDVGADLYVSPVRRHRDLVHRADGDAAPLDRRTDLEALHRLVEVADGLERLPRGEGGSRPKTRGQRG